MLDFMTAVRSAIYPRLKARNICTGSNIILGMVLAVGAFASVAALISHLASVN